MHHVLTSVSMCKVPAANRVSGLICSKVRGVYDPVKQHLVVSMESDLRRYGALHEEPETRPPWLPESRVVCHAVPFKEAEEFIARLAVRWHQSVALAASQPTPDQPGESEAWSPGAQPVLVGG